MPLGLRAWRVGLRNMAATTAAMARVLAIPDSPATYAAVAGVAVTAVRPNDSMNVLNALWAMATAHTLLDRFFSQA